MICCNCQEQRFHAAECRVMLASTMPRQGKGRMKFNVFKYYDWLSTLPGSIPNSSLKHFVK